MLRRSGILTVFILTGGVLTSGLRLRDKVIPRYKLRGETAELRCVYEPESSSIYSVKWFKDDEEFFRYVPRDTPQYHYFTRTGVTLDRSVSIPTRVVLRGVSFNSSGQYRCEVSAEGPDFNTVIHNGSLHVIEPPTEGPVIKGGQRKYHVNDTVDLFCTSGPSRPLSTLSWHINGRPAPKELVTRERPYMDKEGLLAQSSRLVFVARPWHFQRGKLRVKCLAEIGGDALSQHHHTVLPPLEGFFQASAGGPTVSPHFPLILIVVILTLIRHR